MPGGGGASWVRFGTNEKVDSICGKIIKLEALSGAGRSPEVPLRLQLPHGQLCIHRWMRVLPKHRYVGVAEWQNRLVLVKLLVGRKSRSHYQRECAGAALLTSQSVSAPALLAHGFRRGAGGWLLYEFLSGADSLQKSWLSVALQMPLSPGQVDVLKTALGGIGGLHAKGLWQEDLHLGNLLWQNEKLYWVDSGTIRSRNPGRPLCAAQAAVNLGVFLGQLPAVFDRYTGQLLEYYYQGGGISGLPLRALRGKIDAVRSLRRRNFLKKIGRDCTYFSAQGDSGELRAVYRQESELLQPLLSEPDQFIAKGEIIKAGGSSTVARVRLTGRELVVKRYNIKGLLHLLRRCLRPSRAWHSWREAHRLIFAGIATAPPLAMVERRTCWLRGRAYLVTESLAGENILVRFAPYVDGVPPPEELAALEELFAALRRERISHGDLKGTNLIWHEGSWALIDLDAMCQHRTLRGFSRAYVRDRARFLRNWPENSALHRFLSERISAVPDKPDL